MGKVIDSEPCVEETRNQNSEVKNFPRKDRMSLRMQGIVQRYHMGELDTQQLGDGFEDTLKVFENTDSPQTQFVKGMVLIDSFIESGLIKRDCRAAEIKEYLAKQSSGRGISTRDHTDYSTGEEK